jgi:hypothetical protein
MKVQPILSEEDKDLSEFKFRSSNWGYARFTVSRWDKPTKKRGIYTFILHRIVLSRMLGRHLKPSDICDHINRNKLDCRRENLRLVTKRENNKNRTQEINKHPVGCYYIESSQKWLAKVWGGNRDKYLGLWDTMEEAQKAVLTFKNSLKG